MQIIISCQHMDLSQNLREHVETKVMKACEIIDQSATNCQVRLNVSGHSHKTELTLRHSGHNFSAHADHDSDMYAAIDAACDRLRRQLGDWMTKHKNHR